MKVNKFISILLIFVFIFNISVYSLATNIQNQENEIDMNTDNIEELDNKRNEIKEQLDATNIELEYVQTEMSTTLVKIQELDDKIRKYESENKELASKLEVLEKSV